MRAFAEAYPDQEFVQQVVAQLPWLAQLNVYAARTSLTDMRLNDLELRSNTLIANNSPHHRHILPTRSRGSRFFARLRGAQCATLIRRPLRRHFSAMVRMSFSEETG
jgi:hypothetical protein